jgi:hypothetical protein
LSFDDCGFCFAASQFDSDKTALIVVSGSTIVLLHAKCLYFCPSQYVLLGLQHAAPSSSTSTPRNIFSLTRTLTNTAKEEEQEALLRLSLPWYQRCYIFSPFLIHSNKHAGYTYI